jgi:hypothetical protein
MKFFSSKRRMAMAGLAVGLIAGASGLAAAYFTSPGSGVGSADVGTQSNLVINQLGTPAYNSTLTDPSQYQWSMAYVAATGTNDLGNDVTMVNGGGVVSDVVVAMTNFTPTSGTTSIPITLSLYAPGAGEPGSGVQPGTLLGTVTDNVTPPSTAAGANSNTGAGAQNFNVTFDFSSQDISTAPYGLNGGQLVYGISYNDSSTDTGLNVQLAYAQNQTGGEVVGTDTYPGYLFVSTANGSNDATGGPNGEITCSDVSATFAQYSTASGGSPAGSCGLDATPGNHLVPAVEIYTNGMSDLFPGGPQQLINFSVTNPGNTPATVQTVTVSIPTDGNGYAEDVNGNSIAGCYASWFVINPGNQATGTSYTLTVNQTVPAGGTIDVDGQLAIAMLNPSESQDACEGAALGLAFTSN